ncbi:MAG: DUF4360 domain-containing protein [Polyangiales bacterium]
MALGAASFGGCAADAKDTAPGAEAEVLEQRAGGGRSLRDPRGGFIADVIANGTGCPAGTWDTSLSSDGQTFTTTFSGYETEVNRRTSVSIKDCVLTVKLRSPGGRSFSIQSFFYQGYAYLDRGVTGRQTAQYYFQGDPASGSSAQTDVRGPYDRSYLFNDDVAVKNAWSPCGEERNLNIITRIRLTNDNSGRTGYMNLSAVDGSSKLVFRLASRSCRGGNDNGGWNGNDDNDGNDDDWRDDNNNDGNDDDWRDDNNNDDGNDDDWRDNDGNDDDWRGNDDDRGNDDRGGWTPPSGGPTVIDVDRDRL